MNFDKPLPDPCPHCGHLGTTEIHIAYVEHFLAEAEYHCRGCRRHVASFSYGTWHEGTGEPASASDVALIERAERALLDLMAGPASAQSPEAPAVA